MEKKLLFEFIWRKTRTEGRIDRFQILNAIRYHFLVEDLIQDDLGDFTYNSRKNANLDDFINNYVIDNESDTSSIECGNTDKRFI
jgi:hypothetical protein